METLTAAPPTRLTLNVGVIESIRSSSFDGLKALPRRGAEIGGIIATSSHSGSDLSELRLVPCEYLFGPSYHLSPNDLVELKNSVEQCAAEGKTVVAYFRSCTRQAVTVTPEDDEAIKKAFPGIPFIVIAKPSMSGRASIAVFQRPVEGGATWVAREELEAAPLPREAGVDPLAGLDGTSPEATEVSPRASEQHAVSPASRRRGSRTEDRNPYLWYAGVLVIAAVGLVGVGLLNKGSAASAPPEPVSTGALETSPSSGSLGLQVVEENGKLHVMWNRVSPAAISAASGELEIAESGKSRTIPLRPSDITGGSIVYTPHSSDVAFRLQVRNASGDPAEESIRVLGQAPEAVVKPTPAGAAIPAIRPPAPKASASETVQPTVASPPTVAPPPHPENSLSMTVRATPAVRASATAPIPLHEELPPRNGFPFAINTPARVGVLVSVDTSGRVVEATVDPRSRGYSAYLLGLSLKAARGWQFQAATRGGQPVRGEYRIEFVFPPTVKTP